MPWESFNFTDDFQDALLACLITHPEQFDVFGDQLDAGLFNGVAAVEVVQRLKEYYNKYSQYPNFTTLGNFCHQKHARLNPDKAKESFEYVQKLSGADISDRQAIFDMVKKFIVERECYKAVRQIHAGILEGKTEEMDIIAILEKALAANSAGEDMGLILQRDYKQIIRDYATTDRGISTGFEPFNNIWKNGWPAGWLIVPLAPPKRYKTTFCINLALNMCNEPNGEDIMYFACEISQKLAAVRAMCAISGYTADDLFETPNKFERGVEESIGSYIGNLFFKGFPSKTTSIAQIKAHAKKAIKMFDLKPKAIVIDYAETVRPDSSKKDAPDYREQADIYTQARAMGSDLGACIIMPDRCKIEFVERPVPNMKAFQGSFEKAGIVDIGLGLCQSEPEHLQNKMRYFVFLNRHGREGVHFEGTVDPERYRMTVDREIPYDPEAAAFEEEQRAGRRAGGGRRRRNHQSDAMREAAQLVQE